ncbi:Ribosomal large subunit pseudouridine synthase D [Candidatus Moranella endobia PCVAL]|uniref:Pseudouridine synthase n=1 Tax=Moranella endobia (strain PCIT) TaxID=903503 RepID=F7XXS9_MOREP|nr:23S rRNA pseudouridine(1911/1915/1917) synthase RluD [Candidatus Moranella endobia]AEI74905.1 putative pseudouridine synthase, RluA family [Candidatus Moranella endobia PCIT]AGJ61152.1 Ribosomal large subunit pseudouridine synthase D [Candidatus Moranella endobia PCVAL]
MKHAKILTGTVKESQCGQRLDYTLAKMFPDYSRSQIKTWILAGLVWVNELVKVIPKTKMLGGECIKIQALIDEEPCWEAQAIPLNIVYEDEALLIINKPRNQVVHPGAGNTDGTMLNALLYYIPSIIAVPRAGIVHRLDKDTTGLIVVAKNVTAQTRLIESLQAHEITRKYEAIVIGTMTANGTVEQPIARHTIKRKQMVTHSLGKPAVTHYRIMEQFRAHTRLILCLETGRTHQIRVHMAHLNHPIVGDPLYGKRPRLSKYASKALNDVLCRFDRQALHSTFLRLYHPITSIPMEWYAPMPQDMVTLIAALKEDTKQLKESRYCL